MTRYDKYPEVKVKGYDNCAWQGYDQITAVLKDRLQPSAKNVVVVDCYPGVDVKEVVEGLSELKFDKVIYSDECALQGEALTAAIDAYLTEDRVFGVLTTKNFQDVFRAEKIEEAKVQLEQAEGNVLVCGTGAGLITTGDIYIFADLARWEIQMRYRKGMSNRNVENSDAPILTKY